MGKHEGGESSSNRVRWYRGTHADDPLEMFTPEPIDPADVGEPDDDDDRPTLFERLSSARRHRADQPPSHLIKLGVSSLGLLVLASIILWSGMSIFAAHGDPAGFPAVTLPGPSAQPSDAASPADSWAPNPATAPPGIALSPLRVPQRQDHRQSAPVVQPFSDHERSAYPSLARGFLGTDHATRPAPAPVPSPATSKTPSPSATPTPSPSSASPTPAASKTKPTPRPRWHWPTTSATPTLPILPTP
jgi:hypothetical protein